MLNWWEGIEKKLLARHLVDSTTVKWKTVLLHGRKLANRKEPRFVVEHA